MDPARKVVVIGGGIAGLSAAWALSRRGTPVELLEQEPMVATHSSGHNAGIFRCLDPSPGAASLALRSAALLDRLMGGREHWLKSTGVLYVASGREPLAALERLARAHRVVHQRLEGKSLFARAPCLEGGTVTQGLFSPTEGVMDTHAIHYALTRALRDADTRVRTATAAVLVKRIGRMAAGVELASGEHLQAAAVVIAAGAWAADLGKTARASLALVPMRRHLAILEPSAPVDDPVVWRVDDELYFRPEAGGLLACPCDETRAAPGVPACEPTALVLLGRKLGHAAPCLADSGVRRSWAGLRTFAPDRALVVGADPRVPGLFWLAGLGGHGMSVGVGAGELLARLVNGEPHPLTRVLSPARFELEPGRVIRRRGKDDRSRRGTTQPR